jgi:putative SOS response-associated peptidase YedK
MCERYVLPRQEDAEREFVPAHCWWKFVPSFNVSFPQYVPVVRRHEGATEGVMMRWGFVPRIAEGVPVPNESPGISLEWLGQTPDTRDPWLNSQRCILPMAGFYLWQLTPEKYRQPHFVSLMDRPVFGVAALWERSETDEGDVIESFSIVTVPANPLIARLDRTGQQMPAILRRKDYPTWLGGTPVSAKAALHAYPENWMRAHPVSPRVNSPKNNDPTLIRPVSAQGAKRVVSPFGTSLIVPITLQAAEQ